MGGRGSRSQVPRHPPEQDREGGGAVHDLIVIGAGPGGYEAAAHAGELGK
ncbi:MAG TPA: hypothetical protein DCX12_06805, partial [Chloroflexi bacterium]|nr:hypothetical protein [Chloroflexota bacterium]